MDYYEYENYYDMSGSGFNENYEFKEFTSPIKIDSGAYKIFEEAFTNVDDARIRSKLDSVLYDIFKDSPFFEKYRQLKRVDKSDMIKMYYYFKEKLDDYDEKFTIVEFFLGFAEFFNLNYDQLHKELKILDKEQLLREMTSLFNKHGKIKKNKRLF